MPGVVGVLKVNAVGSSGVLHIGDVLNIAPSSAVKSFAGSGSYNTGDFMNVGSNFSVTRVVDQDNIDSSNVAND